MTLDAMWGGDQATTMWGDPEGAARAQRVASVMADPWASQQYKQATLSHAVDPEDSVMASMANFVGSAFTSGTTELIGFDPPGGIEKWRQKHPVLGMASEMLGTLPSFMIPYIGQSLLGLKAMQTFKAGRTAVTAATKLIESNPFLGGAAVEALRWAPLEAAKLTTSVLASPFGASPYNVAKHVAVELPFMATFGGGKQFLASRRGTPTPDLSRMEGIPLAAGEVRVAKDTPGYPLIGTPQEKVKALDNALNLTEAGEGPFREQLIELREHYAHIGRWEEAGKVKLPGMGPDEYLRVGYGRHVQPLLSKAGPESNKRATELANSIYESTGGITASKMVVGKGGFETAEQLAAAEDGMGLLAPNGWEGISQYVRQLFFNDKGARKLQKFLTEDMQRAYVGTDRDLWLAKEASDNGLWFGIGRVQTAKEGRPLWKYYMFKTTDPRKFAPGIDSLHEVAMANFVTPLRGALPGIPQTEQDAIRLAEYFGRVGAKTPAELGGEVWDSQNPEHIAALLSRTRPPKALTPTMTAAEKYYDAILAGRQGLVLTSPERAVESAGLKESKYTWVRYLDSFLSKEARDARLEATEILGDHAFLIKGALAPAMAEFHRSPRAVAMWAFTRHMYDESQKNAVEQLAGKALPVEGRNMLKHFALLRPTPRSKGLVERVEPAFATPEGEQQFWRSWLETLSPEEARKRGYRREVVNALDALRKVDDKNITELQMQRFALGYHDDFEPMSFHYLISRTWVGNYRYPLKDADTGAIVGYAAGHTSGGTLKEAKKIVERVNKEFAESGETFRVAEVPKDAKVMERGVLRRTSEWEPEISKLHEDLWGVGNYPGAKDININPITKAVIRHRADLIMENPQTWQHRLGHMGFAGEASPLSWKDAKNRIWANVTETHKLLAREATWGMMAAKGDLYKLAQEDAALAKRFVNRWNKMQGVAGDVSRAIESGIDTLLSPIFGAQSGSRMAAAFNEATFFLTLGALDAGFVALNAITPVQTVLPELAFLMTAPPERLMSYYGWQFVLTPQGPKAMGYLDPMKTLAKAFKIMANPTDEWAEALRRAIDGGVMSRQFVEAAVGHDSKIMRELLKGNLFSKDESAFRNILNAMQAPVAASEEFSRGLSFIAGRMVGKDFFGLEGEQLWTFAKDVALRTNYGYRTFDRPNMITGPLGTGWGLFKNWTWHYVTNLLGAYSKEALHGNFKPLVWAGLGTGSIAGAMGIPGYGVANGFSKMFSNESLTQHVYNLLGNDGDPDSGRPLMADTFLYGIPGFFGVSMQSRAAAPTSDIMRDSQMLLNTAHMQRAIGVGNSLKHGWAMASRGMNPFDSHNFNRSLVQAFLPRTMQRAYMATAKDGLISLQTGNRVMPSPGTLQTLAYTFGVSPLSIEKRLDAHNELYEKTNAMRERISFYGDLLAQSVIRGGRVPYAEVINRCMYEDVPLDSVIRSFKSRLSKEYSDLIERRWDLATRVRLQQTRGLY